MGYVPFFKLTKLQNIKICTQYYKNIIEEKINKNISQCDACHHNVY